MILQGESYEFGTVFQTDFVALLDVACWMLLFGCCFLAILAINQTTKSQNNKTTKKNAYRNLHI